MEVTKEILILIIVGFVLSQIVGIFFFVFIISEFAKVLKKDYMKGYNLFKVDNVPTDLLRNVTPEYLNNADNYSLILSKTYIDTGSLDTEIILKNNEDKILFGKFYIKNFNPYYGKAQFNISGHEIKMSLEGDFIWKVYYDGALWGKYEKRMLFKSYEPEIKLEDGQIISYPKKELGSFWLRVRESDWNSYSKKVPFWISNINYQLKGNDLLRIDSVKLEKFNSYCIRNLQENYVLFGKGVKWFSFNKDISTKDFHCLLVVYMMMFVSDMFTLAITGSYHRHHHNHF